jgi:hypothetical protein
MKTRLAYLVVAAASLISFSALANTITCVGSDETFAYTVMISPDTTSAVIYARSPGAAAPGALVGFYTGVMGRNMGDWLMYTSSQVDASGDSKFMWSSKFGPLVATLNSGVTVDFICR